MAHQVIIDCDCRRVTAYTQDGVCIVFQGDKHSDLPRAVYDSKWHGAIDGLVGKPYPGRQGETGVESVSGGL